VSHPAQEGEPVQEPDEAQPETQEAPEGGDAASVAALEDRLLRLAAEFDNYKKRAVRDREQYVTLANERLIGELLPILDDLERALVAAAQHEEATLEEGVALVHRSLASLLERQGVRPIAAEGMFDPHVHEALLAQPSDAPEGSIIDVVQKGYTLGDRVVRPVRVVVAGPPQRSDG
jgi:molecular chaperone GrpE